MIPSDIITEILSRLPVKPILRFRCVSKSWCSIIDSDDFIQRHLRQSITTYSNHSIIYGYMLTGLRSIDVNSFDESYAVQSHAVQTPVDFLTSDYMSNSCNGLILVSAKPLLFLWNPFSRRKKILPSASTIEPTTEHSRELYGLGYNSRNNDYKIIRVVEFRNAAQQWINSKTEIYSLKLNSWKCVQSFPYPLPLSLGNLGIHVNGTLHALVEDFSLVHSNTSIRIVCFSVEEEKRYELMLPTYIPIENVKLELHMLRESLCLTSISKSRVDTWVMNGSEESWSQLLSVSRTMIHPAPVPYSLMPLAYSNNGEVLIYLNASFILYDLSRNDFEFVVVSGLPMIVDPMVCIQSLVCP